MDDKGLETFMSKGDTRFQIKDNTLYVNEKKVLTEEKIIFSFWQTLGAISITLATVGGFIVSLIDLFIKLKGL